MRLRVRVAEREASRGRQMRRLVDLSVHGLTAIRMLPSVLSIPIANNGSFDLLTIGDGVSER